MSDKLIQFYVSEVAEAKPVEIMRVGAFTSHSGKEVEVTSDDLDLYVQNFEAGAAGQDVPIDVQHRRDEAAGWLKRVWREGDRLLGQVDWNEMGKRLVGEQIYRYLSATIHLKNKFIHSISLVNFPAIKGLRPVELSAYTYIEGGGQDRVNQQEQSQADLSENQDQEEVTNMSGQDTQTPEVNLEELRQEIRAELEAELEEKEQTLVELRQQVKAEVEAELSAKFERRQGLVQFAEKLCGDAGVALSAKSDDVVEFLEGLDDDQVEAAKVLLEAKIVDFGEQGSSGKGPGEGKEKLDPVIAANLQEWVEAERTVAEFFAANADVLGAMDQYDLSEFKEGNDG